MQLAALHFNENSGRAQAVTKQGSKRYDVTFPKYKKGGYVVRKVLVNATYGKILISELVLESIHLINRLY